MEKGIKNLNYVDINGEIYCLECIESIVKKEKSDKYIVTYKNNMQFIIGEEEYNFIVALLKKYANSFNTY
jgi:hypothetical protein